VPGVEMRRLDRGDLAQGGSFIAGVTSAQAAPASLVMCTRPSFDPTQITPFCTGDSAMANSVAPSKVIRLSVDVPPELAGGWCRLRGQVGTDGFPAGAAVGGQVDELAADINVCVVVAARWRWGTSSSSRYFMSAGAPAVARFGPDAHVARVIGAHVVHLGAGVVGSPTTRWRCPPYRESRSPTRSPPTCPQSPSEMPARQAAATACDRSCRPGDCRTGSTARACRH